MRILVEMDEDQIRALDALSKGQKRSRAALIRSAVDDLLARQSSSPPAAAFGLWGDHRIDGLAYQDQMRGEW